MARSHTSRDFESELRELRAHSLAMGARCERSLQLALEAFWSGSVERATEVEELDRQIDVDAAYGDILGKMTDYMKANPDEIPAAIRVMKVAKYIERIADHATNIAEEVIFMVRGEDVRHVRTHPPPKVQH